MSFFEDYIEDGACCASCGVFIGDDVGYIRYCSSCTPPEQKPTRTQKRNAQKRRAKARKKQLNTATQ